MNRRLLAIVAIIFIVVVIVLLVVNALTPKGNVKLVIAPEEAFLSIDNGNKQAIKTGRTMSVQPGDHTFIVSRDEFESVEKKLSIKNNESTELIVALNPLTAAARELMKTTSSQLVGEKITGQETTDQQKQVTTDYPIVNSLPIVARLYVVTACQSEKYPDDITKVAVCVDLYRPGLEESVLQNITSRGYNPSDYEIIWHKVYPDGE